MTEPATDEQPVLRLTDVTHTFAHRSVVPGANYAVRAVDGVSLTIWSGQILGLVGESGSGKSTLARCIARLLEPTSGRIELQGRDVTHLSRRALRPLRRTTRMVFQDALSAMNPRFTVGDIVAEPLRLHGDGSRRDRARRAHEMLARVGIRSDLAARYPHELSGGQRQRVGIARALVLQPSLLVADEAVSSLDVSVQASILNLLRDLQTELGFSCLFISHDLTVVNHLADHVAVMYLGRVVEHASREDIFARPQHPYTQTLLAAAPLPDPPVQRARVRVPLDGDVPSPIDPPSGCRFRTRCPFAFDRCAEQEPELQPVQDEAGHVVRCHLYMSGQDVPRVGDANAHRVGEQAGRTP